MNLNSISLHTKKLTQNGSETQKQSTKFNSSRRNKKNTSMVSGLAKSSWTRHKISCYKRKKLINLNLINIFKCLFIKRHY